MRHSNQQKNILKQFHLNHEYVYNGCKLETRGLNVMKNQDHTMKFQFSDDSTEQVVHEILQSVYESLDEKGYNPINQIVGYLLSGDPAYIPRHNDARNLIRRFERDEILEELLKNYLEQTDSE